MHIKKLLAKSIQEKKNACPMIFVKKCNQLVQMPGQTFTAIVKDADTNNANGEIVHRK